jgi:hypothetical protein
MIILCLSNCVSDSSLSSLSQVKVRLDFSIRGLSMNTLASIPSLSTNSPHSKGMISSNRWKSLPHILSLS